MMKNTNGNESQDELFAEDILSMISDKPVLLNDLVGGLRGGIMAHRTPESGRCWKGIRVDEVERILREFGAHFGSRSHGAGLAIYVATARFSTVVDGRCKIRNVNQY